MAKKKLSSNNDGEVSFDNIATLVKSTNPNSSFIRNSEFSKIDEWISSGNYLFNAIVSGSMFRGIPNNRITSVAGESSVGKTFLCLCMAREAIKKGYKIVYYDTENAVDAELMEKFGIDLDQVLHVPVNIVEEFKGQIVSLVHNLVENKRAGNKIPKIMFFIDSLSQMASRKSLEDALKGSEKADMTRAKLMKNIFQLINVPLAEIKAPLVFTNHIHKSHDLYPVTIVSGGESIKYSSSIIVLLTKRKLEEDKAAKSGDKTGIEVTFSLMKNRVVVPHKGNFSLFWDKPLNPYDGLERFLDVKTKEEAMEIWEAVGIGRGTMKKNSDGEIVFTYSSRARTYSNINIKKMFKTNDERVFSKDFFDEMTMQRLDDYIRPMFEYSDQKGDRPIDDSDYEEEDIEEDDE